MEKLHIEWMDEPGPTDVLSFPMDELRPGTATRPTASGILGDVVLCPEVARNQADAAGFINLYGLPIKVQAMVDAKNKK